MMRVTISRTNTGYLTENSDGENCGRLSHVGFSSLSEHLRKTFGDEIPESRNEAQAEGVNQGLNRVNQVLAERCQRLETLLAEAQRQIETSIAKKKAPRRRR